MNKTLLVIPIALITAYTQSIWAEINDIGRLNNGGQLIVDDENLGHSQAWAVSDDGSIVVGGATDGSNNNAFSPFIWTEAYGISRIGSLVSSPWEYAEARGISADGSVVAGAYGENGGTSAGFIWTQSDGITYLPQVNGGEYLWVQGISGDGKVVVGEVENGPDGAINPFRWTAAGGTELLNLNGNTSGDARAANTDGSVIVGAVNISGSSEQHAFRWSQAEGVVSIGTLNGGTEARAHDVSGDGTIIVGVSQDGNVSNAERAFRWTESTGMQSLGVLNAGSTSYAHGISTDGSVIVGWAADGNASNTSRAFRYTESAGMQTVEDWLRDNGVTVASDITKEARGTNNDGSVVVGQLSNGNAFIARIAPEGNGLVSLEDLATSLSGAGLSSATAISSIGTAINGAHSRPLSRRVSSGENCAWIAGDWGTDRHESRDGDTALAELGGCHNFGSFQANIAVGKTWGNQNLANSGDLDFDGTYIMATALTPLTKLSQGELWTALSALYHRGDASITRGYLNAGTLDSSQGDTDVNTWGVRARLEWDAAVKVGAAYISPYADLSYIRSEIDAYTETGGGFPAVYNKSQEEATELRLGLNGNKLLSGNTSLIGLVEAAHRFDNDGTNVSGTVIGLSAFDYSTSATKDTWLRGGIGIEHKTDSGTGSVMINATTEGEAPSAWVAASWQTRF